MTTIEPTFLTAIRQSLAEWPTLQLAIEQGMGGDHAREKEQWMGNVIHQFIDEYRGDMDQSELADYISEILDNEFDTIIEDGSINFSSGLICRYCSMCRGGRELEVQQIVQQKQEDLRQRLAIKQAENNNFATNMSSLTCNNDTHDKSDNETMDTSDQPTNVVDPDGWTVVTKKKNRK